MEGGWSARWMVGAKGGAHMRNLYTGGISLKIADLQAPNALQEQALWPCRSAIFKLIPRYL